MYEYASETHILRTGVYLVCFAVRASVGGGFGVLVRKDARNQLPTTQLSIDGLDYWKIDYLSQLDGCSVIACLKFLRSKSFSSAVPKKEQRFAIQLHNTLGVLKEEIDDPLFADALLIVKPVSAPSCRIGEDIKPGQATLIIFRLILPIQFHGRGQKLELTPLNFFRVQQYVYMDSLDHAILARKVHREFGPVLNKERLSMEDGQKSARSATFLGKLVRSFRGKSTLNVRGLLGDSIRTSRVNSDASSDIKLVETQIFGGIMVSEEVSVDVKDLGDEIPGESGGGGLGGMEMADMQYAQMGTTGWAMKEMEDLETSVDTLFAVCMESR